MICAHILNGAVELKQHAEEVHELSIDLLKLEDPKVEELTSRFLSSMNIENEYINERRKYFPEHDHVEDRIKIRLLAQMNFAFRSKALGKIIDENMNNSEWSNTCFRGFGFEPSHL